MQLIFSQKAIKGLMRMPKRDATDLRRKLDVFAAAPLAAHPWAKAFGAGVYRIRQGDYWAVCEVNFGRVVVIVLAVGNRKEIYR